MDECVDRNWFDCCSLFLFASPLVSEKSESTKSDVLSLSPSRSLKLSTLAENTHVRV